MLKKDTNDREDQCHRHNDVKSLYSSFTEIMEITTLQKKLKFSIMDFSVNVTKSAVSCRFGHIY